jgi:hypothetical protein
MPFDDVEQSHFAEFQDQVKPASAAENFDQLQQVGMPEVLHRIGHEPLLCSEMNSIVHLRHL